MTGQIPFERFLNVRSAYGASFDASGQRIYFVSTTTGVPNLWGLRLDRPDAWPEPVAVGPERVQYAFASSRPGRLLYGLDRGGDERTQLWLLDGVGNRARALTDAPEVIHHFGDWHADGRQICYAANARDQRYFDIYAMDVERGESRLIYRHDSNNRAVGFEPGGRRLLIQRLHAPFAHELLLVDPDDGSARTLTGATPSGRYESARWLAEGRVVFCTTDREHDRLVLTGILVEEGRIESWVVPIQRWRCHDSGSGLTGCSLEPVRHPWDVDDFAIAPDGRSMMYAFNEGGYSALYQSMSLIESPLHEVSGGVCYDAGRWMPTFAWSPDGRQCAWTYSTPTSPPDVWLADYSPERLEFVLDRRKAGDQLSGLTYRLTRSWDADLPPTALSEPELVHYPTFDRRKIPAFIFRPPNSARDGSLPALFFVHGGPESQFRPSFNPVVQYFAHRGFVVVAPNVRGSTGYGKAYSHLDDVDKRLDAVRDLAAGAEWLAASGEAHPRKIAVMGSSYGGYMVLAALTERPDLWAAGVEIVGIANFVTFLERTGPWRRRLREAEYGSLERDRAFLERLSPIHRVERITAPLMVVHGANDPRVPISESEQIVATLRGLGRPIEYLRFEDEGHGLVKLDNRLVAYPRIADFLERVLDPKP